MHEVQRSITIDLLFNLINKCIKVQRSITYELFNYLLSV